VELHRGAASVGVIGTRVLSAIQSVPVISGAGPRPILTVYFSRTREFFQFPARNGRADF